MGKGCKVLLIVGIVIFLIAGTIITLVVLNKDKVMAAWIEKVESQVLANLPEGFSPDEVKSQFRELKDMAQKRINDGTIDWNALNGIAKDATLALDDKKITPEELTALFDKIKKFVGQ